MKYAYPYVMDQQPEGGWTILFPDIPEAISQANTQEEAQAMAEDALVTALSFYTDEAQPLPKPSRRGNLVAFVPPLVVAKLALHDAMLDAKVSNVVLAHRLGTDEKAVRRLRDPLHRSHIENIAAALRVFGKRLVIDVLESA